MAIGKSALASDTKGNRTIAIGFGALDTQNFTSSTDTQNTAIGFNAGTALTTANRSTFVGYRSGQTITTQFGNAFFGNDSGISSTGQLGTFIGDNAGQNATGNSNTLIGQQAGYLITSGGNNSVIGRFDGNQDSVDIRTSSNYIVLSDGDGNVPVVINNGGYFHASSNRSDSEFWNSGNSHSISTANTQPALFIENSGDGNVYGLGIDFTDAAPDNNTSYFLICQDSSTVRLRIWGDGDVQNHDNSYGALSDEKLKEQIADASSQWEDIKALKVRKFKMKEDVAKGDSDDHWRLGVVAQEVETAGMNGLVKDNPELVTNSDGKLEESGTTTKSVKYSILYMKAVKALQEAMTRIETLETEVKALKGE